MDVFTALTIVSVLAIAFTFLQIPVTAEPDESALIDGSGWNITEDTVPERIVSLSPANTEILFAIGAGDRVVGVTEFCDYPEEAKEREKVGSITMVNIEKVVSLEPDLVLGDDLNGEETFARLEGLNITVVMLDAETINEILDNIMLVGTLTGGEENASLLVADMESRIEKIRDLTSDVKRPTVAQITWHEPIYVTGSGTVQNEVIEIAGGVNAFSYVDAWGTVSLEELIMENPEVLIVSVGHGVAGTKPYEYILSEARLKVVDAVKTERVYAIDADIISRKGPRIVDAVETVYGYLEEFFACAEQEDSDAYTGYSGSGPKITPTPTSTPAHAPASTQTPQLEEPGFEAVVAIGGLLVVGYLVLRRKRL